MKETYRPDLKAHVSLDAGDRVRAIRHTQEYWESDQGSALGAAVGYVNTMAGVYGVPKAQLANLEQRVQYLEPQKKQGIEFRLAEEKADFDSTTLGFSQTYANIPVWNAGVKVTVKQGPNRVVHSVDTSHDGIEVKLPSDRVLSTWAKLIKGAELLNALRAAGQETGESEEDEAAELVRDISGLKATRRRTRKDTKGRAKRAAPDRAAISYSAQQLAAIRFIRGRFWIYQYDEEARFYTSGKQITDRANRGKKSKRSAVKAKPTDDLDDPRLPVGPVSGKIQDGEHYVVAEVTFEAPYGQDQHMPWQALVELETRSVLYLRALTSGVNGLVYEKDPYSKTGTLTATH